MMTMVSDSFGCAPVTPDKHGWPLARISPNSCIIYAHYWLFCHMSQWRILWLTCNWTAVKRKWYKKIREWRTHPYDLNIMIEHNYLLSVFCSCLLLAWSEPAGGLEVWDHLKMLLSFWNEALFDDIMHMRWHWQSMLFQHDSKCVPKSIKSNMQTTTLNPCKAVDSLKERTKLKNRSIYGTASSQLLYAEFCGVVKASQPVTRTTNYSPVVSSQGFDKAHLWHATFVQHKRAGTLLWKG